ncbi:MAG TPA: hypothetical protein VNU70_06035 [Puia sp.]|jgi:hypothetical protein|nr:hypothetical protein [Puia sp.]
MRQNLLSSLIPGLVSGVLLAGCVVNVHQQAFYVSPLNGNAEDYHPMPLQRDSAHTALYARIGYFSGDANDRSTDKTKGGTLSFYAAHHFGMVQCFFGPDFSLGTYNLGTFQNGARFGLVQLTQLLTPLQSDQLQAYTGSKSFGSIGFSGGINLVTPLGARGEWRFLGVETSLQREFGDYLSTRRELPDSLATLIIRNRFFGTAGITSEIIGGTRRGEFGFRFAGGWVLGSAYHSLNIYDSLSNGPLTYYYFDASFHYTFDRYTAYYQVDGGKKATTIRFGFIYRFGRPRLTPRYIPVRP